MNALRRVGLIVMAGAAVTTVACRKKPAPVPVPVNNPTTTAGPNVDSIARARAREDSIRRAQALRDSIDRARADSIRNAASAASAAAAEVERMRTALLAEVHFDYDLAELRDDAKAALDSKVPVLRSNATVMIRIAGHTDNRGSDEYNLALGQRRAAAAKQYLIDKGIPENRIETISYGEERPRCQQEDETCYFQNRRAEFEITAGSIRR